MVNSPSPDIDYCLTQADVAARLGMKIAGVAFLRRTGRIAFHRFGHRTIRFSVADVKAYAEQAAQRPKECGVSGCGRPLLSNNQTGICQDCRRCGRRVGDVIRKCQGGCGRRLRVEVSGDVCYRCQSRNRQADRALAKRQMYSEVA